MMRFYVFVMKGIIACLIVCFSWIGHADAMALDGPWYYREGFSPANVTGAPSWVRAAVTLDAGWQLFNYPDQPPLTGKAPFVWLTTVIPAKNYQSPILFFTTTEQSFRVYLDTTMIYRYGSLTPQRFSYGSAWHMLPLPSWCGGHRLTFEMYSTYPHRLGQFDRMALDESDAQLTRLLKEDIPYLTALPVNIVMFIFLLVYVLKRRIRDRLYVFVMLFFLLFSVWLVGTSNIKQLFWNFPVFWQKLHLTITYLLPLVANLVLYSILEASPRRWARWIIGVYAVLFIGVVVGELAGLGTLDRGLTVYYVVLPALQLPMFWALLRSARQGNLYSKSLVPAALIIPLLGLYDGLASYFHVLPWAMHLVPFGVVTFVVFMLQLLNNDAEQERRLMRQAADLELQVAVAIEKSQIDPLTKCFNRSKLNEALLQEPAIANETKAELSLIMFDIDLFKQVNDTFGHTAGDTVLVKLTAAVRQMLDARHTFIRYGGEEFVLFCRGIGCAEARDLAEHMRERIAAADIFAEKAITVSLGVSCWHGGNDSGMELLKRADQALYAAKNAGRNCVRVEA